ncbi:unnamed protein product [Lactuca saligna]|uniref:Uncharacterized protein n=1 Tax=Lactuca saligna TaxID=75948 RepID=A0AA35ZF99_LACSI|nr:unnamed protein product [Lactuca saligna]
MKQENFVFKTPEKKTTQEIKQSPKLKMIEYRKFVTPIKVEDTLVKKESNEKITGKTPMREIDWCGFITNCLKISKTTWDDTDRGNYYCVPLLVLLLAYLEFTRNDKNEKRQIHALHFWDYEMMVKREKAELKSRDFGTLEWNDDVIENDEKSDTNENEDMKLDEGDESNEDEHMKKEIKDEKLDEGESYDSEETECDNNILGIEDDEDKKRERSRKKTKKTITEAIFSL